MDYKVVQDYVITPVVLGKGCFGTVYRGYMKNNKSQLLAVKAIPIASIKNEEIIRREIEILLKLDSPNIVKYLLRYVGFTSQLEQRTTYTFSYSFVSKIWNPMWRKKEVVSVSLKSETFWNRSAMGLNKYTKKISSTGMWNLPIFLFTKELSKSPISASQESLIVWMKVPFWRFLVLLYIWRPRFWPRKNLALNVMFGLLESQSMKFFMEELLSQLKVPNNCWREFGLKLWVSPKILKDLRK